MVLDGYFVTRAGTHQLIWQVSHELHIFTIDFQLVQDFFQ